MIFDLIELEKNRQNNGIELIASENYPSINVMKAQGSILTSKYAEGYPGKRYYGGCEVIDKVEQYAIDKACELFKCKYANVQPHSGSQANAAAYRAVEVLLRQQGKIEEDRPMRILTAELNDGAHLTHSSPVSFVTNTYNVFTFGLKKGKLDVELIEKRILELIEENKKPDVLLIGFSSYPYSIKFSKFKPLADKYDLKYIVDMAHIAGLVAAGIHESPVPFADVVTSTTHKTLRGPRGGLILTNDDELFKKINSAVFPYYQGGPLEHVIAAKAICFEEALKPEFKTYITQVLFNTKVFTDTLIKLGATCSKTENHLMLLNTKESYGLLGIEAQKMLEEVNITVNKNMLPSDTESPRTTSGLRIGFAAITSRGCEKKTSIILASIIDSYLKKQKTKEETLREVNRITRQLHKIETLTY